MIKHSNLVKLYTHSVKNLPVMYWEFINKARNNNNIQSLIMIVIVKLISSLTMT